MWLLTTPIPGLFLAVSPYLGGTNLHFHVRYTKEHEEAMFSADPGRQSFFRRQDRALRRWWSRAGHKLYFFGWGSGADLSLLAHKFADHPEGRGKVVGLFHRRAEHQNFSRAYPNANMFNWWLARFLSEKHPDVRIPQRLNAREVAMKESGFIKRAQAALAATMADLKRPTGIRDLSFCPLGDTERDDAAKPLAALPFANHYEHAGCAPEYLFSAAGRRSVRSRKPRRR